MKYRMGMKFQNKVPYEDKAWTISKIYGSQTYLDFDVTRHGKGDETFSCSVVQLDEYIREGILVHVNGREIPIEILPKELFEL